MALVSPQLHAELWTSWASLLRSYAAAHGLNVSQHAVVEISSDEITLRVGPHWLRFTPSSVQTDEGAPRPFCLNENGTVTLGDQFSDNTEDMDVAAERFARELLA